MFRSAFVLLAVLVTLASGSVLKTRISQLDGRIVGGKDTTIYSHPYAVSFRLLGSHNCGGNITNNRTIITCSYSVQYGAAIIGGTNNVVAVKRVVQHENYNSSDYNNDIALIFLGWGAMSEGGVNPSTLQEVFFKIIEDSICRKQYNDINKITHKMLCAGINGGGKDICQGDSGGPLVANGQLVSVVSWGVGCARPKYSSVYCDVAALRRWIDSNIS